MSEQLEHFNQLINKLPNDLRAETVLASLFTEEMSHNNLWVAPNGQFRRPYRKDILSSEITDFDYDESQILKVNISRDGIYDMLPEAVFHYPASVDTDRTVPNMTHTYRKQQQEEKKARQFFAPFEHEVFLFKIKREKQELDYLMSANGNKPFDFLYELWDIDPSLPVEAVSKLFRLLPIAYKLTGNIEVIKACLNYLLNEPVEIKINKQYDSVSAGKDKTLSNARLGVDMVMGSEYEDFIICYEFIIGPLANNSFLDYIYEGPYKRFLDVFFDHFLPVEVEYKVTLRLDPDQQAFKFSEKETILGMTTTI